MAGEIPFPDNISFSGSDGTEHSPNDLCLVRDLRASSAVVNPEAESDLRWSESFKKRVSQWELSRRIGRVEALRKTMAAEAYINIKLFIEQGKAEQDGVRYANGTFPLPNFGVGTILRMTGESQTLYRVYQKDGLGDDFHMARWYPEDDSLNGLAIIQKLTPDSDNKYLVWFYGQNGEIQTQPPRYGIFPAAQALEIGSRTHDATITDLNGIRAEGYIRTDEFSIISLVEVLDTHIDKPYPKPSPVRSGSLIHFPNRRLVPNSGPLPA